MAIPSEHQAEALLLNSFPVELHWRAGAVYFECATRANCVRTNENPVLPCGEATEDSRLKRLCASKAQIRLEPSQSIWRLRGTRLDGLSDFVFPVQIIRRGRYQSSVKGLASRKFRPNSTAQAFDLCVVSIEANRQTGEMIHHGQRPEVHFCQRQFQKRPGEAGSWLDNCIDLPGCDVDAGKRPTDRAQCFADEPIVVVVENEIVYRKYSFGISARFENPESQIEFVRTQGQNGIIQLSCHFERPPVRACCQYLFQRVFDGGLRRSDRNRCRTRFAIPFHIDVSVMQACFINGPLQRS